MTELRDATIAQALCDAVGYTHAGRELERLLIYLRHPSADTTTRPGSDGTQERTLSYARYGLVVKLTEQLAGEDTQLASHPADTWVLSRLDFQLRLPSGLATSAQINSQTRPWQTAAPFGLDPTTETPFSAKSKLSVDTYPQQFTLKSPSTSPRNADNRRSHFLADGRVVELAFSARAPGLDALSVAYMGGAKRWQAIDPN
jgi:hypothetical protein